MPDERQSAETPPRFPVQELRACFPALNRPDPFIFFDNAAGAQAPQAVLDAVAHHLLECNVQRGGRYAKSMAVDATIERARQSVAAFLNASDPGEVAFGMNATSFIRLVSLAIGRDLGQRNEIVVTDLDHEANVATWLALERDGAEFRWWRIRDDGALHPEDLEPLLSRRSRLVACTASSNAIGTMVDVAAAAKLAHEAGAELFLDAVHYGPHAPIDVQAFGCDYLACSGYKIFSPHMGFLWGRREALEKLDTFREDFIPNQPPDKIEAGTCIYENVAGMDAAIGYLESLGRLLGANGNSGTRRGNIARAMEAIREYEMSLSRDLLRALAEGGAEVYGIGDPALARRRVPTFLFNIRHVAPSKAAEKLAAAGIGVRDGHMYAPRLMKRLHLRPECGGVRASLVHYNTKEEIARFSHALRAIANHAS